MSIWLTLSLAFWRYEVLKNGRHHQRRKSGRRCHQVRRTLNCSADADAAGVQKLWRTQYKKQTTPNKSFFLGIQERCTRTIIMAYVGSIVLCIPSFVLFGIEQQQVTVSGTVGNHSIGLESNSSDTAATAGLLQGNVSILLYKVNLNPIAKNYDGLIHKVWPVLSPIRRNRFRRAPRQQQLIPPVLNQSPGRRRRRRH